VLYDSIKINNKFISILKEVIINFLKEYKNNNNNKKNDLNKINFKNFNIIFQKYKNKLIKKVNKDLEFYYLGIKKFKSFNYKNFY